MLIWKSDRSSRQHRLELLVGLVDLVDEQDDGIARCDRGHQGPRQQELLAEDVLLHVLPAGRGRLGLDPEKLLAVVPLVQGLGLVEALVALEPYEGSVEMPGERLGQLRLAHAGGALDKDRLAQLDGQERDQGRGLARQVTHLRQAMRQVLGASWRKRFGFHRRRSNIGAGRDREKDLAVRAAGLEMLRC